MEFSLLKKNMDSIEMSDEMQERIVRKCRTLKGERRSHRKLLPLTACTVLFCVFCSACAAYIFSSSMRLAEYQGPATFELMPHDFSLSQADIPFLIDKLSVSNYLAVYADSELYLRVTRNGQVEGSENEGATWEEYLTENIPADDFAEWVLQNDPAPGYSMSELQSRLSSGALVTHLSINDNKELYFVIDGNGAQVELVQRDKIDAILLDGQRMMFTSHQFHPEPLSISEQLTKDFYGLLVSCDILNEDEADQDFSVRIYEIGNEDNSSNYILVP